MAEKIRIKLDDPGIDPSDKAAAIAVLETGQLVNGSRGRKFERKLQHTTGRRHGTVVSSGTAALLAAMRAFGIGPGSTVVVPAFTFPAPASVAGFLGAAVRLCDVDPKTFCVSPATLEPHLDDSVSLVVAVDQFGVPAPVPDLERLLNPRGIPLLVDAACSLGSTLNGEPCGSLGSAATLSFHPRKVITTGEGGAVLTDYEQVASRVKWVVNHGIEAGEFASYGLNLRMSEVAAAIGSSQIKRLDMIVKRRRLLARRYFSLPLQFQEAPDGAMVNYQTLAAVLPDQLGAAERADLISTLRKKGIEANIASYCIGAVPALSRKFNVAPDATPAAHDLHHRGIALPLHQGLGESHIDEVAGAVFDWLNKRGVNR